MNKTGPGFFNSGSEEFKDIFNEEDPHEVLIREVQEKNSIELIHS
jgi:hypothetical protein